VASEEGSLSPPPCRRLPSTERSCSARYCTLGRSSSAVPEESARLRAAAQDLRIRYVLAEPKMQTHGSGRRSRSMVSSAWRVTKGLIRLGDETEEDYLVFLSKRLAVWLPLSC